MNVIPISQPDSPVRIDAEQKRADAPAMRMSEAQDRAMPPPKAGPFTAAMITCGVSRMRGDQVGDEGLGVGGGVHVGMGPGRRRLAPVLEVEAGAEPPPGTGEDDDLARRVRADLVEGGVEVGDEVEADGVEPLGAVQAHHRDVRLERDDLHGAHGAGP